MHTLVYINNAEYFLFISIGLCIILSSVVGVTVLLLIATGVVTLIIVIGWLKRLRKKGYVNS